MYNLGYRTLVCSISTIYKFLLWCFQSPPNAQNYVLSNTAHVPGIQVFQWTWPEQHHLLTSARWDASSRWAWAGAVVQGVKPLPAALASHLFPVLATLPLARLPASVSGKWWRTIQVLRPRPVWDLWGKVLAAGFQPALCWPLEPCGERRALSLSLSVSSPLCHFFE